ncbi:MAG: ABC transporter permease [Pirellulaceae bacterium]|nr:ABC transporter permease [Pirellulaceae bacterium]MDP6557230.1 ABC transporter permease [Pirellulaceae bacterium]
MTLEQAIPNFSDWIGEALFYLPLFIVFFATAGFVIGYLVSAIRRGPVEGFYAVAQVIGSAVFDLANTSVRRTLAMAMLAVQESIRRKVLIAFAVFIVVLLFAGWYLDVKSDNPGRLYLSFVLTSSNYLVLILALFLSTFSLPADIKNRTIYTIVTKPVRGTEIVLGRIIGFMTVGTAILVAMCLVSYLFVVRGLSHEHQVDGQIQTTLTELAPDGLLQGVTTYDAHHRHTITMYDDGTGETDVVMGHYHSVKKVDADYKIGPPQGGLAARVVRRGDLRFKDRSGNPGSGVNVGHEWAYRSYIEGGTLAAAVWTFDGMTAGKYPEGFNLELNLRVFRTHKGNIEKGIRGSITIRNPKAGAAILSSEPISFSATEFAIDRQFIPRQLKAIDSDGTVSDVDLFKDLTDDGKLEVWIQCSERGQYYGMAEPDVYVLENDGNFAINFIKGFVGIWLQMLMVTTFGVGFSTFLSGPVGMLATLSTIVVGLFRKFIVDLVTGVLEGGGPMEALIRTITQANLTVDLDIGTYPTAVVKFIDGVFLTGLNLITISLPDYAGFSMTEFVATGFNIEPSLLVIHILRALTYFVFVTLIGYFFLKTREVAA